ncbi:MAG: hypothetical protein JEZ10_01525 [Verrucomicrobia bacterium]|nr:hypothetical protein [Verrucomicrobiota bacterium]
MSLIQDALKRKLEEEQFLPPKEKPATPPAAAPDPTPAPAQKPAPDSTKLLLLLVAIIVLLLIGLGVYLLLRPAAGTRSAEPARSEPVAVQPVIEEVKAVEKPVEAAPPAVEKEPAPPPGVQWPELNLTGFASGGTERLVIINGKTLSTGSRIEGARILQIGKNEVAIEYQGEQHILRVDNQ